MKMRHYLPAMALALAFAACSDDYDDSALWDAVNGNTQRIEALEAWQAEVNNNIAALQQLLNTNDMITAVTPVTMGGETVGYTLSFLHSDPVTIYNGTQGEKGEAGDTPQIGLTQGEDGNWYWTLNGELMTNAEGNPIRANGEDGEDGTDGTDGDEGPQGPAGADAPTPEIKLGKNVTGDVETDNGDIIDDAWYLSVDEGETWYRVSGEDGKDGDSIFSGKPELSDDESYYIFTLSDGTKIEVPLYQGITITFTSSDNNPIDPNKPITVTGSTLDISYSVNGIEDAKLSAIPSAEGWSATVEDNAITVTVETGAASECDLLVTATDNAGKSVSYTLLLEKSHTVDADGTYIVYTAAGLQAWATAAQSNLSTNCTLAADITLTGEWTPIGTELSKRYTGTFDGDNHTISGLIVTGSDEYAGLFGVIGENGTVKNVKLENVQITSDYQDAYVGGVGYSFFGNIENCSVSGSVSGAYAGGVVGVQFGGTITLCGSSVIVEGTNCVGGVAGLTNNGATLTACYATGDVTDERGSTNYTYAGGVVGYNAASTLTACYATGDVTVTGGGTVGGITGDSFVSTLTACYWQNNQAQGIGDNFAGTVETTLVDGSTVTWTDAMNAMNNALSGTGWKYVSGSGNEPLTLQKQ